MVKEIGSEFWIDNIVNENLEYPPWTYIYENTELTSSGRGAISLMLEQIKNKVICKTVLLPAYICESIIIPFKKQGYSCYFYNIKLDLKPDIESINKYNEKNIGVFLHMGYFGFNTNDNLKKVITSFKEKRSIIVEDVTHTLFSKLKDYEENDFALASIRKWLGVASGGILSSKYKLNKLLKEQQINFYQTREQALKLKTDYMETKDENLKPKFLELLAEAEEVLDTDPSYYSIDDNSISIMNELDVELVIQKRRENYLYLLDNLKHIKIIIPVFEKLPDNNCPLFFPIYVKRDRDGLRKSLIGDKIYCPIHWPIPTQVDVKDLKSNKIIYDRILSVPCDQRYNTKDMIRIIEGIEKFYAEANYNQR